MPTDIKSLTAQLSGAGERIRAISAGLEETKLASPAPKRKVELGQVPTNLGGILDWAKGVLEWGGWSDIVGLYKELVDAGIVKPAYDPPEKMTEAEIRRIISDALAAAEKPLWQKALPWVSTATLGVVATVLLVKKFKK